LGYSLGEGESLLKDAYVDIIPGCHLDWSVALRDAGLNLAQAARTRRSLGGIWYNFYFPHPNAYV